MNTFLIGLGSGFLIAGICLVVTMILVLCTPRKPKHIVSIPVDVCTNIMKDLDSKVQTESSIDKMRNLCDTCTKNIVTCICSNIEFGDGIGKDNVISCSDYENIQTRLEI
jgi:hypothetical protein